MSILSQSKRIEEVLEKTDIQLEFETMVKDYNRMQGMIKDSNMAIGEFSSVLVFGDESPTLELYVGVRVKEN